MWIEPPFFVLGYCSISIKTAGEEICRTVEKNVLKPRTDDIYIMEGGSRAIGFCISLAVEPCLCNSD